MDSSVGLSWFGSLGFVGAGTVNRADACSPLPLAVTLNVPAGRAGTAIVV